MPPKRRGGAQAKHAPAHKPSPPDPPTQPLPSKLTPAHTPTPAPAPAPTPFPPSHAPPVDLPAARVRREWSKFIDAWYEPRKKKLAEKLQKDLLVKYKNLGPLKDTQKLREMELFEKLDAIALQLAQPSRAEWERRLELAHLREDQWDDMSGEEQQAVMSVFVGFFADDFDDMDDDSVSDNSSVDDDLEVPQHNTIPPSALASSSKQPIPPTPIRGNFEFVNPTSFFADTMTPLNPSKNLPALSMDHLATLGPSNAGRSPDPVSANTAGTFSYQNWASEAGIIAQQPPVQPAKPPPSAPVPVPSAQSLNPPPRAADIVSRQASTASNLSSPPFKTISPQYSPANFSTKFSPQTNAENLPLGKRYIGPIISEEDPDPLDEDILKSKMAEEYHQYKISLRIQMIYQFHAEAAEVEIKLVETLLAGEGTKESRARAVLEHETNMMRLRDQKEEERKKLCAEEREKRREEIRQQLAQRRSAVQNQVDPVVRPAIPSKGPLLDKPLLSGKVAHQKENIAVPQQLAASPSMKLEPPSIIKKSNSTLSQGEASANEAIFASAMAMMAQGKANAAPLTPSQASLNEAVFSNAATLLTTGGGTKSTLQPPSAMKKSNSSRSQEHDVPHITVSFAENPVPAPEPAQPPPVTIKGKKGKKGGQVAPQPPPTKSATIIEEPELFEKPPPSAPTFWDGPTDIAKNAWGAASASISVPKAKLSVSVEEEPDTDLIPKTVPPPSKAKANANTKKPTPVAKKGKKVTITEEPDVDADPIISPASSKAKVVKGGWGSVNEKYKLAPPVVEEIEPELCPAAPPVAPAWGKKATPPPVTKPVMKPQLKVTISEEPEQESEFERAPAPTPARTSKGKSAWGAASAVSSASTASKKAVQQQAEPRRDASKSVRMDVVPDPEDHWLPESVTPESEDANEEEEEEEIKSSAWFKPENISYWANFIAGQPEAEPEPQDAPIAVEETGKHVRWTPIAGGDSDGEEDGDADEELATNMWMQYAISGGDVPTWGDGGVQDSRFMPSESAPGETGLWEQGRGKKSNPPTDDFRNRVQQTSVFDRAALNGQWPKMESWLSPPSRGQNSGSTRVF